MVWVALEHYIQHSTSINIQPCQDHSDHRLRILNKRCEEHVKDQGVDTNTWLIRSIEIRIFFDLTYEWHTSGLLWTPWYTLLDWLHRIAKTLGTDPAMTISSVSWAQQATLRQHVLLIFGWKFPSNNQRISTAKTWGMLSHHDGLRPSWPLPDGRPGRSSERPFCFSWKESH